MNPPTTTHIREIHSSIIAQGVLHRNKNRKPTGRIATAQRSRDGQINEGQNRGDNYGDCMYHLIDYRNGNKVIMKKIMPRIDAYRKNAFLAKSGKAWARVGT